MQFGGNNGYARSGSVNSKVQVHVHNLQVCEGSEGEIKTLNIKNNPKKEALWSIFSFQEPLISR